MIVQIGPLSIHVESLVLGIGLGVLLTIAVDRYILVPAANWLERLERRWHGRLRAR